MRVLQKQMTILMRGPVPGRQYRTGSCAGPAVSHRVLCRAGIRVARGLPVSVARGRLRSRNTDWQNTIRVSHVLSEAVMTRYPRGLSRYRRASGGRAGAGAAGF
jgi:hypothetical protein